MGWRVLPAAGHRQMPWANGRGVTTELARRDVDGGRLLFRLSVADVVEAGPFSRFPGVDRNLLLIEGEGFDITVDGARMAVRPFAPVAFPGEADTAAVDLCGPSRDFNLMTGRGLASVRLTVAKAAFRHEADDHSFAFVVSGAFACEGRPLEKGSLLAIEGEAGRRFDITGDGVLVVADIRLAREAAGAGTAFGG